MWVLLPSFLAFEYFALMETVLELFDGQADEDSPSTVRILALRHAYNLYG